MKIQVKNNKIAYFIVSSLKEYATLKCNEELPCISLPGNT